MEDEVETQEPTTEEVVDQQVEETSQEQTEETNHNPNWDELLNELPDDLIRNKVRPHLEKFDRNNNSRFEKEQQKYAPYRPLIDNQISYDDVQVSLRLRQELQQNPQKIFEQLARHLNVDLSRLNGDDESQDLSDDLGEETDPQISELKRTQEAMLQYMAIEQQRQQEAAQQRQEQQWYNETASELDKLNVPKEDRNRVVELALNVTQRTGKPFSVQAGFDELNAIRQSAIRQSANLKAPSVSSGNGNLASEAVDFSKMTEDEINQYAVLLMKQKNGN